MALAVLFEVPETPQDWQMWAFANMAHHRDINRRVFETLEIHLSESILDPFDYANPVSWLYKHQLMHDNQNAVLGIQGFNLIGVNWDDDESLRGWIMDHANEHVQAGKLLELG